MRRFQGLGRNSNLLIITPHQDLFCNFGLCKGDRNNKSAEAGGLGAFRSRSEH